MRTARSLGVRWVRENGSLGRRAMMVRTVCLAIALGFISGVAALGNKLAGESCGNDSDCYGGKKCLGGRCCAFTVQQYEQQVYQTGSVVPQNMYAGCIACSGAGDQEVTVYGYPTELPLGTCKACDAGTKLLSNSLHYDDYNKTLEGFGKMLSFDRAGQGRCAAPCGADEYGYHYGDAFSCQPIWEAGQGCGGSEQSPFCASGLCGYQNCCAESECSTGICQSDTGACETRNSVGGSCDIDDDCYGGKKCLGGRCCAFTVQQYEQQVYQTGSVVPQNMYAGCIACSGAGDQEVTVYGYPTELPLGTCKACDAGTKLLSNSLHYDDYNKTLEGFGKMLSFDRAGQGRCAAPCGADEYGYHYGDAFSCQPIWEAGQGCGGSEQSPFCASGLCGYQNCCAESECSTGICQSDTGACETRNSVGGSCDIDDDCYGGKKCLGGRCCAFTVQQYEQQVYQTGSVVPQNMYAGCIACSGAGDQEVTVYGYPTELPLGTCKACDAGTKLLSNSLHYDDYNKTLEGFGKMLSFDRAGQGRCAAPCGADEYGYHYGDAFSCQPIWEAGQGCGGSEQSPFCASGLCGYQNCCDGNAAALAAANPSSTSCCSLCNATGHCLNPENCVNGAAPTANATSPTNASFSPGGNASNSSSTPPSNSSSTPVDAPSNSSTTPANPPSNSSSPTPDTSPDDGYPGTTGCERVCEGVSVTAALCEDMSAFCEWDDNRCWSSVGGEPCPEDDAAVADFAAAKAKASLDAVVAGVTDPDALTTARLLGAAAIGGASSVTRVRMVVSANTKREACDEKFVEMGLEKETQVACVASVAGNGRRLAATNFNVTMFINPLAVSADAIESAMSRLERAGVAATREDVDPTTELATVPGVNAAALQTFAVDAALAAETNENGDAGEASGDGDEAGSGSSAARPRPPPPPMPPAPPRQLVLDDDSGARGRLAMAMSAVAAVGALAA